VTKHKTWNRFAGRERFEDREAELLDGATLPNAQRYVEQYADTAGAGGLIHAAPNTAAVTDARYAKLRAQYEKIARTSASADVTVAAASACLSLHYAEKRYRKSRRG
jgi:hypothetical protein